MLDRSVYPFFIIIRFCFADRWAVSFELWVASLSLRRLRDYKTTSGCRLTAVSSWLWAMNCELLLSTRSLCTVSVNPQLRDSIFPAKPSRRLVSTSVRHHSSIPLKYSPLGGNTGGYGGEEGLTMSNFAFKDYRQPSTDNRLLAPQTKESWAG